MNVVNCRKCGRLFNHISGANVCPSCKEKIEKKFQEVKEYIRAHNNCPMAEVCEACDVDPKQIQTWIRQERLQFAEDSPIKVTCENCGANIGSGRFCNKCKNEMAKSLSGAIGKPEAPKKEAEAKPADNKNKMRFL